MARGLSLLWIVLFSGVAGDTAGAQEACHGMTSKPRVYSDCLRFGHFDQERLNKLAELLEASGQWLGSIYLDEWLYCWTFLQALKRLVFQ